MVIPCSIQVFLCVWHERTPVHMHVYVCGVGDRGQCPVVFLYHSHTLFSEMASHWTWGLPIQLAWSFPASTRAPPASASSELGLQAHTHVSDILHQCWGPNWGPHTQLSYLSSSTLLTLNLIYIIIEKHIFVVPWLGSRSTFIRILMVFMLIPTVSKYKSPAFITNPFRYIYY